MEDLGESEIETRIARLKDRMRPLEENLAALRSERDVLLTELRRRRRLDERTTRADLKTARREGKLPTVAELVAASDSGSLDDYL